MLRILSVAVVLGLVAGAALGQGEDQTYTIKIKKLGQGQTQLTEKSEHSTQTVKILDNNGNLLKEQVEKKATDYVYRETVLQRTGDQKPTKLKRKYEKAVTKADGQTTKLPYQGKTVLIEKKGDRYEFRVEGGDELTGDDAKDLEKEFNKKGEVDAKLLEKLFLPGKAIKVGESWKIDAKVIANAFQENGDLELAVDKTTATGKLTRAYKNSGRQFGVVMFKIRLVPQSVTKDGNKIRLQPKSHMTLEITYDGCIDGSVTTNSAVISGTGDIEALLPDPDNPMFRLTVIIHGKGTSKHVEQ